MKCILVIGLATGLAGYLAWETHSVQKVTPPDEAEARLAKLGYQLPATSPPLAAYKRVAISGNLAFVSGHLPLDVDGGVISGKLGADVTAEQGANAARRAGLGILASLKAELGSLDRVKRVVKTLGLVNATPEFGGQPAVINGCSELFRDLYGEDRGIGARSAVGVHSLPRGACVEIEMILEIKEP
jgi:enamine deaminase RidA (YjgF/YER057c/UK114 family)